MAWPHPRGAAPACPARGQGPQHLRAWFGIVPFDTGIEADVDVLVAVAAHSQPKMAHALSHRRGQGRGLEQTPGQ